MMTHKFEVGDRGKTRDGKWYTVMLVDFPFENRPIIAYIETDCGLLAQYHYADGRVARDDETSFDLMSPVQTRTAWIPLLRSESGYVFVATLYATREEAMRQPNMEVIGVSSVIVTEGEWLE